MDEKLLLIGDFVSGTWDEVVRTWCETTGLATLCLAASKERATAYLVVAKHEFEVQEALDALRSSALPVIWVNEFKGKVECYPTVVAALETLSSRT